MTLKPVTINLPPALIADLRLLAAERDESPGDMIRALLLREVARLPRGIRPEGRVLARIERLPAPARPAPPA